jgi:hypothetical protein
MIREWRDGGEEMQEQHQGVGALEGECPFRILKRVFGFTKVRYRSLKNHEWLLVAFALINLYQRWL